MPFSVTVRLLKYRIPSTLYQNYRITVIRDAIFRHRKGAQILNTEHILSKSPYHRGKKWQMPNTAVSYAPHEHPVVL